MPPDAWRCSRRSLFVRGDFASVGMNAYGVLGVGAVCLVGITGARDVVVVSLSHHVIDRGLVAPLVILSNLFAASLPGGIQEGGCLLVCGIGRVLRRSLAPESL